MKKGFADQPRAYDSGRAKARAKRAVNVSVDAEILALAKEMKINLSRALEDALRQATEDERVRRAQEEFRPAIEAHNRFIEKHGTMSEAWLRELYGDDIYGDDEPSV
jgi:antitoxin CcdA